MTLLSKGCSFSSPAKPMLYASSYTRGKRPACTQRKEERISERREEVEMMEGMGSDSFDEGVGSCHDGRGWRVGTT